ncbi:MAG: DegQ family serine endoprotease [Betaproteobacteria bacterium]|nr:DegQ family serine endoprotease [Betaproteobacteria bacterium]
MRKALAVIALLFTVSVPALAKEVMDVADLVQKEGPAVVNISTTKLVKRGQEGMPFGDKDMQEFFRRFFPGMPPPEIQGGSGPMQEIPTRGEGSGFVVSNDGYILTNAHVVKGADEVVVKLTDKRTYTAKVVGTDPRTDVAVIKITAKNLPVVTLGDPTKLRVGEAVAAIGSPFGFENSVTAGIVSAKDRSLPSETYVPFIQTDVPINPGNSGGPLFNMKGEVVGINSQIYSRSGGYMGVSFAIPIDVAMEVAKQLESGGKISRGWLGVVIQEVTADLADSFGLDRPRGALVSEVQAGSPAQKAGLQSADVILEFNGKPVENSSDLPRIVGMSKPGTKIPLQIWRNGKARQLSVVLGELPGENQHAASDSKPSKAILRGGVVLSELSADQRRALDLKYGVLVADATGDAARAGIQTGDVILAVNNTKIASVAVYRKAVADVPAGKTVALLVRRGDGSLYVPLRISGG